MNRPVYRAVLPPVQDWLRSHVYFAVYVVVALALWGIGIGLTR